MAAVFLSAFSVPSQAATIAGTKCTKVGSTKTTGGVKYFCVKSGSKLVWNKGKVVKKTPTPKATVTASKSPTPTKTASPTASVSSDLTQLTLTEVKKHDSATSCWSVVSGNVYDLTKWITKHPGGASAIRGLCGVDGTSAFERKHAGSSGPEDELANYLLGKLGDSVKL